MREMEGRDEDKLQRNGNGPPALLLLLLYFFFFLLIFCFFPLLFFSIIYSYAKYHRSIFYFGKTLY